MSEITHKACPHCGDLTCPGQDGDACHQKKYAWDRKPTEPDAEDFTEWEADDFAARVGIGAADARNAQGEPSYKAPSHETGLRDSAAASSAQSAPTDAADRESARVWVQFDELLGRTKRLHVGPPVEVRAYSIRDCERDAILALASRLEALEAENRALAVERAWLIEWPSTTPQWWNGVAHYVRFKTPNANHALRFARKEDAERCINTLAPTLNWYPRPIATEHVWIDAARKAQEDAK